MSQLYLNKAVPKRRKEGWCVSEEISFRNVVVLCNHLIALCALAARKLKAKRESDSVQGPTECFVYSFHPKFTLIFFCLFFPFAPVSHFRLYNVVVMHAFF